MAEPGNTDELVERLRNVNALIELARAAGQGGKPAPVHAARVAGYLKTLGYEIDTTSPS